MNGDGSVSAGPLRAVVEVVVRALVDKPEAVRVNESERRGMTVLELTTAPGDMGKIIGKRGRIIRSLRTLAKAAGQRVDENVTVEVVD